MYSMDAYFRQTWVDKRLKFSGPLPEMRVHIKVCLLITMYSFYVVAVWIFTHALAYREKDKEKERLG